VPYGTDSRLDTFQPRKLSGLATIISPFGTTKRQYLSTFFEATSLLVAGFEDEDDDSLPDEALPSSVGSFVSERSRENEAPSGP
jgi:hypothetical protein